MGYSDVRRPILITNLKLKQESKKKKVSKLSYTKNGWEKAPDIKKIERLKKVAKMAILHGLM